MSSGFAPLGRRVAVAVVALALAEPAAGQAMSYDELRACAAMAVTSPQLDTAWLAQRAEAEAMRAQVVAEAAAIAAARPLVDRSRRGAVALFNDRVARACAAHAAYVAAASRLAAMQNAAAATFNAACADRDFDPDLVAALPGDMRAAWDSLADAPAAQSAALSDLPPQPVPLAP